MSSPEPTTPEALLRHAGFLRSLARSLTRDAHAADDLTQEAWVAALRHPPRHERNLRGWFATVLRRSARREATVRARREQDERTAARPEAMLPTDTLRHVTEAVLALREPYRETLMERFYLGLTPADIARRHDVPAATVRSRLKRALAELRVVLDRETGGRKAWSTVLLAFARGGLFMSTSKTVAAVTIALAALVLIPVLRNAPTESTPAVAAGADTEVELRPAEEVPAEAEEIVLEADASPREEVASAPDPATSSAALGALRVQVVYADDGSPATDVGIEARRRRSTPEALDYDPVFGRLRARTDEDGVALLTGLEPGSLRVLSDHRTDFGNSVDVVAGEEIEILIELAGLNLTGIVVDANDVPVPGASLELAEWAFSPVTVPKRVAVSDENGRFDVRAVPTLCSLGARAPGYAPTPWQQVLGSEGGTHDLRLVLPGPEGRVEGRVVGPDGSPIAGAAVLVGRPGIGVHTDEEGVFRVVGCPPGDVPIAVRARDLDLAPWSRTVWIDEHGTTNVEVELEAGLVVTGTVSEADGAPARGVRITAAGDQAFAERLTLSAANGSYRLPAVPAGAVELQADGDERGRVTVTVTGTAGEVVPWNPQLGRGLRLPGIVLDENDEPVPDAFVHALSNQNSKWFTNATSDAEGRFVLLDCPEEGTLWVTVEKYQQGEGDVRDVDPHAGELIVRLPVKRAPARIVGDVLRPDGSPVASAAVTPWPEGQSNARGYSTTADTGRIEIEDLIPGTYTLIVEAPGFARFRSEPTAIAPGGTWDIGTIRLELGGTLTVALDETPPKTYLQLYDAEGRWKNNVRLNRETKEARTPSLPAGSYGLLVHGDIAAQWFVVELLPGEDTRVEVEVSAGLRVELRFGVTEPVLLHLEGETGVLGHYWARSRNDEPTRVELALEPGVYTATARTEDGRAGRSEFVVAEELPRAPVEILLE